MARSIGIDLGASSCCVAVIQGARASLIRNAEGDRLTPSCVGFSADGEIVIGTAARRQAGTHPRSTISSFHRLLGRKYAEVLEESAMARYVIVAGPTGDPLIE